MATFIGPTVRGFTSSTRRLWGTRGFSKTRRPGRGKVAGKTLAATKPSECGAAAEQAMERTRHERASLLSCVGEPLKRSVGHLVEWACRLENFLGPLTYLGLVVICYGITSVQGSRQPLAEVKKIFVESYPTSPSPREDQIGSPEAALRQNGFEVVNTASQADAVLAWQPQVEIVLHGDGSDPDKSIFNYQLMLADKRVIWKHSVKFVSKKSSQDDLVYAAKKMAKRLFEDKQKAIEKTR